MRRALKNKPKWKPSKGYKYLKDIEPGTQVLSGSGMIAILLEISESGSTVFVTKCPFAPEDKYYLGKQRWASKTEIKEVNHGNG